MTGRSKNDAWDAGDSYEEFMGRWSRKVASQFVGWFNAPDNLDWLEVGCGSGALSSSILEHGNPRSLIGIDPSEGFVATARRNVTDGRATFETAAAQTLPLDDDSTDVVTSGLVLNFIPDIPQALSEMKRVVRPGGAIAFYVWDYPGNGLEFVRAFWEAATSLDPRAFEFAENKRFEFCTPNGLTKLAANAGLQSIECSRIEVSTMFENFQDYWHPFTLGTGPAPGYCVSLEEDARERLRQKLDANLSRQNDGSIALKARAWAIKGVCL
jgi:ubiquinone/menaquinone biosynthesis C-methylase UbiE